MVNDIREFLKNKGKPIGVDFVVLCVEGSAARLAGGKVYLFDKIKSIFKGRLTQSNLLVLCTFADCAEPPAIKALNSAGIKYV